MLFDVASNLIRLIRRFRVHIISAVVILLVLFGFATLMGGDVIRRGIVIDGMNVSGLELTEARTALINRINEKYPEASFKLKYGGREWSYHLADISYSFLVDDALEKAYSMGRSGGIIQQFLRDVQLLFSGQSLEVGISYDRNRLFRILKSLKSSIDAVEKNAEISYNGGKLAFKTEKYGRMMDIDRNVKLVENQLGKRNFDNIELQAESIKPRITLDKVKNIDSVLSSFSTRFNRSDVNRSDNISLACSRINGVILLPGDEFSMNEALGPRTLENGYKEAPVIFQNELVAGTGGGVCQVTTTLYDTVLLAKLDVLERTHHSMPLAYVQPGQDATIAEGSIDFRFVNSLDYAVCLNTEVRAGTIYIRILGKSRADNAIVRLHSEVIAEYPPDKDEIVFDDTIPFGEEKVEREARKGIRAVLYRDTYAGDGRLAEHEKISEDYYKPAGKLVKINSSFYDDYLLTLEGIQDE